MKISNWFIAGVVIIAAGSCIKDDKEEIDPQEKSQVKWTYSLSNALGKDVLSTAIPAFDEKNTGYYLVETDNTGANDINNRRDVWICSVRGDSSLHWKVKVSESSTDALDANFVVYSEGKVLAFLKEKLVCLDSLNGKVAWNKTINREYWRNSLSVANGKLFYIDQAETRDKLKGISLANGSELCSLGLNSGTNEDVRGDYTAISGNNLFVVASDIINSGQWLSKILIYNISSISNATVPASYLLPQNLYPKSTIVANSKGDALFYAKYDMNSPYQKYLVSINSSGVENFKTEVPSDANSIYIDAQDNIYCTTTSNLKLLQFNSSGNILKETSYVYFDTFGEFEILENNTFYGNAEDTETGMSVMTTFNLLTGSEVSRQDVNFPYALLGGTSIEILKENQRREEENSNFSGGFVQCVDRTGNLISISREKIYCVKDLDKKLLQGAWSKDFANYGNTNSR